MSAAPEWAPLGAGDGRSVVVRVPATSANLGPGFDTLGLQTFLTAGPKESRAWTIRKGATAPEAAGVIHTDFQKGFIKAEVVHFDDLVAAGTMAEARARGKVRIEGKDYSGLFPTLKGQTAVMFASKGNAPAKLISDFRKKNTVPSLKSAWIEEAVFIGDDQLAMLTKLKGKEELIGDIIALLQSPIKTVIGGLQGSGGQKIAGLVKALEERAA